MKAAGDAFDGVSFHGYAGSVRQQGDFSKLYPSKVRLLSFSKSMKLSYNS